MLFLMGVLALLLTTPNANADDKEKYKLFADCLLYTSDAADE